MLVDESKGADVVADTAVCADEEIDGRASTKPLRLLLSVVAVGGCDGGGGWADEG